MDKTEFCQKIGISFSDISDIDFQLVSSLYAWGTKYDNVKDHKLRIALLWKLGGMELIKELLAKFDFNINTGQCNTQAIFYNHNREMVELKIDEVIAIEELKQKFIRKQQKAEKQFLNDNIFNNPIEGICKEPVMIEDWAQKKLIRF